MAHDTQKNLFWPPTTDSVSCAMVPQWHGWHKWHWWHQTSGG